MHAYCVSMQEGHTPLHTAVRVGTRESVRALLGAIADAALLAAEKASQVKMSHFLDAKRLLEERTREKSLAANAQVEEKRRSGDTQSNKTDWQAEFVKVHDKELPQLVMDYVNQTEAREYTSRLLGAASLVSLCHCLNNNDQPR